jgi:hypothetical protein
MTKQKKKDEEKGEGKLTGWCLVTVVAKCGCR